MTLKQLLIVACGGGFAYLLFIGLEHYPTEVWLPPVVLVTALTVATAFLKINQLPFISYVLLAVEKLCLEKKRRWKAGADTIEIDPTKNIFSKKSTFQSAWQSHNPKRLRHPY